jgi:hypothetical protein
MVHTDPWHPIPALRLVVRIEGWDCDAQQAWKLDDLNVTVVIRDFVMTSRSVLTTSPFREAHTPTCGIPL